MSSQAIQTLLVALIVAGAALYVAVRVLRTVAASRRRKDGGCAGGCDCSAGQSQPH